MISLDTEIISIICIIVIMWMNLYWVWLLVIYNVYYINKIETNTLILATVSWCIAEFIHNFSSSILW